MTAFKAHIITFYVQHLDLKSKFNYPKHWKITILEYHDSQSEMYVYCIQKETMYGTYTRDHIGKCSLTFRKPLSSQFGWTEHHKWLGTCTHSLTGEQDGISTFMVSKECAHNSPNRTRHIEPCSYQQLQQSDTSTDTTSCLTLHISKCSYSVN